MSWDVWVERRDEHVCVCRVCGSVFDQRRRGNDSINYTSNTANMLQAAAIATGNTSKWCGEEWDGLVASDVGRRLRACISWMANHGAEMRAMNPPNGWGDFDSYLNFLQKWADMCDENPNGVVRILRLGGEDDC